MWQRARSDCRDSPVFVVARKCSPFSTSQHLCALCVLCGEKPLKESGRLLDSRRGESRFLDAGDFAGVELHEGEALSAEILERRADEVELLVVDDQESIVERFAVADGELRILGVEGTLGTDPTKVAILLACPSASRQDGISTKALGRAA